MNKLTSGEEVRRSEHGEMSETVPVDKAQPTDEYTNIQRPTETENNTLENSDTESKRNVQNR